MNNHNQNTVSDIDQVAIYLRRAKLTDIKVSTQELIGDASERRYVRVYLPDSSSQILSVYPEPIDPNTLPFLNVARLLQRMPLPIPNILGLESDLGIIILEDLGKVTLQRQLQHTTTEHREALYIEAIELIIRMQQRGNDLASNAYFPFELAFNFEKLMWELDFFTQNFLISHRGVNLSTSEQESLQEEFSSLSHEIAREPRVLCHRDYHARNLMLHKGRLHVIDFQDARMGPDTYDLVSLLRDSYFEHDSLFIDQMIGYYLEQTRSSERLSFLERFDLMSVQRHLKALGTFGYQTATIKNAGYQDAIPRTLCYLKNIFKLHSRFSKLHKLLASHLIELE